MNYDIYCKYVTYFNEKCHNNNNINIANGYCNG